MNDIFRSQFPALQRIHNGQSLVFLDGPGGTQVPEQVIAATANYYRRYNSNSHGQFITAMETDEIIESTREHMSAFLGAEGPHTISLGANMTSLNYSLSRAMGRALQAGDEVLITQLDHEANRGPWLALREHGIIVREVVLKMDGTLDYEDFEAKMNERTRLVAMGYASNILGTVNDVQFARKLCYHYGALLLLDAVHYAPHFPIDVQAIGCDFLLCSAYKFYGPHIGILYSKPGVLDRLPTDRLRTAGQVAPDKIETGTPNHAAFAGVGAAVDFIASFGEGASLRDQIVDAMNQVKTFEKEMVIALKDGLIELEGITIHGLPAEDTGRTPTLAITVDGKDPVEVCKFLNQHNICAWDGHFYALRAVEVMQLLEKGGVTRLGISAYTSPDDVQRTIQAFKELTEKQ